METLDFLLQAAETKAGFEWLPVTTADLVQIIKTAQQLEKDYLKNDPDATGV